MPQSDETPSQDSGRRRKAKSPELDGCHNCKFWREDKEPGTVGRNGECRALPPYVLANDEAAFSMWPQTEHEDWCGAHRMKVDA